MIDHPKNTPDTCNVSLSFRGRRGCSFAWCGPDYSKDPCLDKTKQNLVQSDIVFFSVRPKTSMQMECKQKYRPKELIKVARARILFHLVDVAYILSRL